MVGASRIQPAPTFSLVTLGCAKNEVDSDAMRSRLLAAGFSEVEDLSEASVCLVNTCGFLASAIEESIEATLLAAGDGDGPRIMMCGCVPSRYGAELAAELPEVDAFLPVDEEERVVEAVCELLGLDGQAMGSSGAGHRNAPFDPDVLRSTGASTAFLKIAEGCSRRCAFCAIPLIRGPLASRSAESIVREAVALASRGAAEITLIAQDTTAWGRDLPGCPTLASLIRELSAALSPHGTWIRLLYAQPEGVDDELIDALATSPGVVPYLDMPIQHVSERLLRSMGRRGGAEWFRTLIATLRERIPNLTLRTSIICGYPGETDAEHAELLEFLSEVAFDYVAVFPYSAEEGTRAAELPDQVDEETKLARVQAVRDLTESIGFERCAARVGSTVEAIIDAATPEDVDGAWVAHGPFQAPDTDGVIHVPSGTYAIGDKVWLALSDAWCFDLEGEEVPRAR